VTLTNPHLGNLGDPSTLSGWGFYVAPDTRISTRNSHREGRVHLEAEQELTEAAEMETEHVYAYSTAWSCT